MHKILKVCQKILRISLACFFILTTIILITFSIINIKLSYEIPKITYIELYDNQEEIYASFVNGTKQSFVKLDDISPFIIDAFLSIEDKRFFEHQGVDILRLFKAIFNDLKAGKFKEGASTITQQFVRAIYLNNQKTIKRKLHEILISINIETKYSKEEILEGYLNTIYFDHGIYGIQDASRYYFNKDAQSISLNEACILASIPKGPSIYSPIKNYENNFQRKNLILAELLKDNKISIDEYNEAKNLDALFYGKNDYLQNDNAPYFQDMVVKEIKNMPSISNHLKDGIKVYTTLDSSLNKTLLNNINNHIVNNEIEIATYAIEPNTGKILSVIGGTNYQKSTLNRVTSTYRQPGSTIKPFLYLSALENGFTLATTFKSEPTTFNIDSTTYSPKNYQSIYPNTDVSMLYAIATSDNIYAMKTHLFLGTNTLKETIERFNISNNAKSIPSLALGTIEVSLENLVNGYQALANNGIQIKPYMINKITTLDNEVVYEHTNTSLKKVASSDDVYLLNEALTSVFDPNIKINILPTCARISSLINHKVAAKSGSTTTDNLIIGFTPDILIGIWTGYDDNRVIKNNETSFGKVIFAKSINSYLNNINNPSWYQTPDNVFNVNLSPITGFYGGINEYTKDIYFKNSNVPWYIEYLYIKEKNP